MKFAFSTLVAPQSDFQLLAGRARELGYDGVELVALPENPVEVRNNFASAGIAVACLGAPITMPAKRGARVAASGELRRWIDAAHCLGCARVKIPGFLARAGQTGNTAAAGLVKWLLPVADFAAEHGVTIVVENALSFRTSRELWMLLESINHPNVAACWDLSNAFAASESPFVSVPCLNSRIQYARVQYCEPGEGKLPVENFLTRLRGIGYGGYVTVDAPDALLPDAIGKLRAWTKPPQTTAARKPAAAH